MAPLEGFTSYNHFEIPVVDILTFVYEHGECKDWDKPVAGPSEALNNSADMVYT